LLPAIAAWANLESTVESAVLFGSRARDPQSSAAADATSDVDLHIVASESKRIEMTDWSKALPGRNLCLRVVRPASGGVRKLTLILAPGEIDMVIVPSARLRLARIAMLVGLHRRVRFLNYALNELSTIMRTGYRFLKGERTWGCFYARVVAEMPGARVDDLEAQNLADVFLCDLLWVLQRLDRGELIATQRVLHRSLAETNFRLLHELRLRRGLASFREARRAERLLSGAELTLVQIDARIEAAELHQAAWQAFDGVVAIMREIVPGWKIPAEMYRLLNAKRQFTRR
jgi:hypothetical protein